MDAKQARTRTTSGLGVMILFLTTGIRTEEALRKGWYRGMQARGNCGALRLGHAESGAQVAEITPP
jgi:hypothetical protein